MSVVGIDFGDESSYVAVARQGGIETVDNDYSLRATPSFVAFGGKQRILGVAAKNQHITNVKNTIYGFKRLVGRKFNEPMLHSEEVARLPFDLSPTKNGVGVNVNYLGEMQNFSAEQITAMFLSKLKETAEQAIKTSVHDCVLSCPSYFTNAERQGLLDAASMSGLNVLRLLNDTTATALSYGIYKQDLPGEDEPPRNVVFVDCGHSALQVFACAFNKGKLKMLCSTYDPTVGGKDFTTIIATHFCDEFKKRYEIDPRENHRAYIRLSSEVEKLKKQMSANSTQLPFNIECLMDEKDVSSSLTRGEFEAMASELFKRVDQCLKKCLEHSGLKLDEIYAVEIVGGASRTPEIKHMIERAFCKVASTTLNQDEAVARGCALMCAILSPVFKVKEFGITDVQQFPIKIIFDESSISKGEMEVFPQYHPIPSTKLLTFHRREPFTLLAAYNSTAPFLNPQIGTYTISNVKTTSQEDIMIKIKARVNINGMFSMPVASGYEKCDQEPEAEPMEIVNGNPVSQAEPMQQESTERLDNDSLASLDSNSSDTSKDDTPAEKEPKAKKQQFKVIDLPIQVETHGFDRTELNHMIETEGKLFAQDRLEKDRIDAKNALEEYVYDLRDKLETDLKDFLKDEDRLRGIETLNEQEDWLYGEGEDERKGAYLQRLEELKDLGEPIKWRKREFDGMSYAFEKLSLAISRARKVVEAAQNKDPSYDHLGSNEIKKLVEEIDNTSAWLDKACGEIKKASRDSQPPILLTDISQKKATFNLAVTPIINKSKTKVQPRKEEPMDTKESKDTSKIPTSVEQTEGHATEPVIIDVD